MRFLASEWIRAAGDDLLAVKKMMEDDDLTHLAAFHAQQCVEKSFKAVLEENLADTPKIHGLLRLYELVSVFVNVDFDKDTMKTLDGLYIDARYPGMMRLLPDGKPDKDEARAFHDFAEMVYGTIKHILDSNKP